ncbi:MAG: cytochrome c oxidase accessory protein CcoG [Gammaproteobacteria bacterium]
MPETANEVLIQANIPVFPRSVKGQFRNIKWIILGVAYGVYFLLPWLRWERSVGPDQAVLFDIVSRRFYLFDWVLHAQDLFWLAGFLVVAALLLFFITSLAGRVFCGYFCFQTLWTDLYLFIERRVQGDRVARIRLDKSAWSFNKIFRKTLTHLLWLLAAFWTGFTFTLYWENAPELIVKFFTGEAPFPAYATTLFLTATTYVMAGMAREQVCTYMCPYSRFQAVMFDSDTRIVAYDEARGEAKDGRHKINRELKTQEQRQAAGAGDCIDCGYCVQVCPVGIDIRNGLQIQCISCALCIDACDTMMGSLGWEKGLIRYSSENQLKGLTSRLLKPKSIGYAVMLVAVAGLLFWNVGHQLPMEFSIVQVRQPLFVRMSDGRIQNSYELHLENKTNDVIPLAVMMDGLAGAELDLGKLASVEVPPQRSLKLLARVRWLSDHNVKGARAFHFNLIPQLNSELGMISGDASFYLPGNR